MRAGEYSIYIVRCNDGTLYTGIAIDVERRIEEHQAGPRGAKYLRGKGPLRLEFSEMIGDRSTAQQFEYRVKRLERERKEALIAGQCSLAEVTSD
jgi:putative endonuclease